MICTNKNVIIFLFLFFNTILNGRILYDKLILYFVAAPKFVHLEKMKRRHYGRPVGSSVRLKCKATGNPNPHIAWMKDNQVINDAGKKPMWTLKLTDLIKSHSGKYTCLVNNRLGSINYTYTLEVIGMYIK